MVIFGSILRRQMSFVGFRNHFVLDEIDESDVESDFIMILNDFLK